MISRRDPLTSEKVLAVVRPVNWSRYAAVSALVVAAALSSCGLHYNDTETARWLRAAGHFDDSPEVVNCADGAMQALLSDEERAQWLSHDPDSLTVETLQSLPHATDIADRCRHLM